MVPDDSGDFGFWLRLPFRSGLFRRFQREFQCWGSGVRSGMVFTGCCNTFLSPLLLGILPGPLAFSDFLTSAPTLMPVRRFTEATIRVLERAGLWKEHG